MTSSKQLRVLEIGKYYPPHRGGMESHVRSLCREIAGEVELTVLVAGDSKSTTTDLSDGYPVIRVGTWGNISSAPISPALPYFIRQNRPDVIHIHMPHPTSVPAYFAAARDIPLVITYHSDIVRQRFLAKAVSPVIDFALRRALIICTSQKYMESSKALVEHRERCRVIPLAIRTDEFDRPDRTAIGQIQERYGPNIVLATGRLVYYKGFEYLIRAMRQITAAHLLIIGEGPLLDHLLQIARECGVAERVTLLGQVDDLSPYYHAADMFVLPSIARSEAFGMVQLEAMACGIPVINTQLDTGVPDVSIHGATGLTVPPQDEHALARAINSLLVSPNLRAQFGAAARERVLSKFNIQTMANDTLDVLHLAANMKRLVTPPLLTAAAGRSWGD